MSTELNKAAQEVIDALNARDADRAALFENSKRDDIIRMAREAGFVGFDGENKCLRAFAALVAAAEREACAKTCEELWLCEKTGHLGARTGWIHNDYFHRECKLCGRIISEPIEKSNT